MSKKGRVFQKSISTSVKLSSTFKNWLNNIENFVKYDETSPEDDTEVTVSSASLCMSPSSAVGEERVPVTSTPMAHAVNGHDSVDNGVSRCDSLNRNVNVNIAESTNSMDVLSGGESDAGDTLNRRNNNSISSTLTDTLRDSSSAPRRRYGRALAALVADELLMTERTYKRDLELVTVTWSSRVSSIAEEEASGGSGSGGEAAAALARACLALEPLALPAGKLLARLERQRAQPDEEQPEYKKVADLLYDYLSSTYDAYTNYMECAGALVALVESVRRRSALVDREMSAFEASSPLPLSCLLLRPLHRLLHIERLAIELADATNCTPAVKALELSRKLARGASEQLRHGEHHAALCRLQRDVIGYDKLLVADREFVRLGCVYKHSTRGLQQRMLFLFSDILLVTSKSEASGHFRAHAVLPLHTLSVQHHDLPHSFTITGEEVSTLFSCSNEHEFAGWLHALELAVERARDSGVAADTALTPLEPDSGPSPCTQPPGSTYSGSGTLTHVCWHRVTSLSRDHLHLAMRSQLSGCLLRKFKNSVGWQKLWVTFAALTLFFYKSWRDAAPLASLPLLGYSVGPPSESDNITKEFVFKLQFKNHVYFFRANSQFTYNRWTEVLQTAMVRPHHN